MYKYETHLHTYPVSKCAKATVRESLVFYKDIGYDGVFITNHFLDGNINISPDAPYKMFRGRQNRLHILCEEG